MFELVSFIEYVSRLPSKNSTRVRAHYIGYRCIRHTWIWNDDERCHITDVNGDYKINMAFYCRMASQTVDEFEIDEEEILRWRKSVVIRGVYKSPPKGRGRGQGRGRGHRGRERGSSAVNSPQKGSTKPNNADAPDEEKWSGQWQLRKYCFHCRERFDERWLPYIQGLVIRGWKQQWVR